MNLIPTILIHYQIRFSKTRKKANFYNTSHHLTLIGAFILNPCANFHVLDCSFSQYILPKEFYETQLKAFLLCPERLIELQKTQSKNQRDPKELRGNLVYLKESYKP